MKDRLLAARYAGALLSVLDDPTRAEAADDFLDALRRAMDDSAEFRDLMLDPAVPATVRRSVLTTLASEKGMSQEMSNFLQTLIDHGRTNALPAIAEAYHEAREEAAGITPAEITTALPLTDELRRRAQRALETMTGRRIQLTCKVEPGIIGGAVTRIGSMLYDGSLRTQLHGLQRRMRQE